MVSVITGDGDIATGFIDYVLVEPDERTFIDYSTDWGTKPGRLEGLMNRGKLTFTVKVVESVSQVPRGLPVEVRLRPPFVRHSSGNNSNPTP